MATANAVSMIMPMSGICLISTGDKRITRNASQITTQIAKHDTDAARNIVFAILGMSFMEVRNVEVSQTLY
jgi:hypothetical protein